MSSAVRPARVLALAARTLSRPTAPFREGAVIAWVRAFVATRRHLELREDPDGNLEIRRRGVRPRPSPLVLAAHMDHPGFRVLRSMARRDGGVGIDARFLGGVRPECFAAARVRFFVDEAAVPSIPARVVAVRRDRRRGELRVALAAREPVPPDAFGTWDLPPFRQAARDPDLLETRAADDLAGVTAILALLDAVPAIDPARRVDVRGVLTRAEEVGFIGALAIARGRRLPARTRIVAIEASRAFAHAPQGAGPILRVGDRTSVFDDPLTRWIAAVGAKLAGPHGRRFRWQRRLMDGGTCESTAYQLYGYRCAAMCLPLGNYHNMTERGRIGPESIRLSDLTGLVRFFEGMVRADAAARRTPGLGGPRDPLRERLEARFQRARRELARDPFGKRREVARAVSRRRTESPKA